MHCSQWQNGRAFQGTFQYYTAGGPLQCLFTVPAQATSPVLPSDGRCLSRRGPHLLGHGRHHAVVEEAPVLPVGVPATHIKVRIAADVGAGEGKGEGWRTGREGRRNSLGRERQREGGGAGDVQVTQCNHVSVGFTLWRHGMSQSPP